MNLEQLQSNTEENLIELRRTNDELEILLNNMDNFYINDEAPLKEPNGGGVEKVSPGILNQIGDIAAYMQTEINRYIRLVRRLRGYVYAPVEIQANRS